tara:strand:- start:799 stop:1017 length:219 start_codon:yes stop_codon:yes gene_type:complete
MLLTIMKNKNKVFFEGFNSALDLSGLGFSKNYRFNRNINNSWYNVGTFFTKGFNEYTNTLEDNKKRKKSLQY